MSSSRDASMQTCMSEVQGRRKVELERESNCQSELRRAVNLGA